MSEPVYEGGGDPQLDTMFSRLARGVGGSTDPLPAVHVRRLGLRRHRRRVAGMSLSAAAVLIAVAGVSVRALDTTALDAPAPADTPSVVTTPSPIASSTPSPSVTPSPTATPVTPPPVTPEPTAPEATTSPEPTGAGAVDPAWLLDPGDFGDGDQPPPTRADEVFAIACTLDLSGPFAGAVDFRETQLDFPDGVVAQTIQGYADEAAAVAAYAAIDAVLVGCVDSPPEGQPITELSNYLIEGSDSFRQGREIRWAPLCFVDGNPVACEAGTGERAEAVAQIANYVVHLRWQATLTARGSAESNIEKTWDKMRAAGAVD